MVDSTASGSLDGTIPGPEQEPPPTQRRCFVRLTTALLLWAVVFIAGLFLGPALPFWPVSVAYFLGALTLIALATNVVIGFQHLFLHRTTYLLIGAMGLAAVFVCAHPHALRTRHLNQIAELPGELIFLSCRMTLGPLDEAEPVVQVRNQLYAEIETFATPLLPPESPWRLLFLGLAQLTLAAGIGLWIGFGIDEVAHLIPIALVAGLADIWSVSSGATAVIIRSPHIHYFLLRFPMLGGAKAEIPFLIGLTDFLFFAIFFTAAVRFSLDRRRNLWLLLASFVVTVALALFFQVGLPVLPFMALLFVWGNWGQLQVKRDDLMKVGAFLLFCGASVFVFTRLLK